MVWLGLLLRPLVVMIGGLGCTPRTLADDLFLHSSGAGHFARLKRAGSATHRYLRDAGSRVSPT
eukprot:12056405-Alexandrium_andersonii.AAC.1